MKLPKLLSQVVDLVFPNICVGCQREVAGANHVLCIRCIIDTPFTDQFDFIDNSFTNHFWGRVPVKSGAALMIYNPKEISQNIIHNFKYRNRIDVGRIFGKILGERITKSDNFNNIDLIIPVPLTSKKLYHRGYNQSYILSQAIGEVLGVPINHSTLLRIKDSQSQTKKSRIDRIQNMTDAFKIQNGEVLDDKHILLIDDVLTTGATLESCAIELLKHTNQISMATLAIGK